MHWLFRSDRTRGRFILGWRWRRRRREVKREKGKWNRSCREVKCTETRDVWRKKGCGSQKEEGKMLEMAYSYHIWASPSLEHTLMSLHTHSPVLPAPSVSHSAPAPLLFACCQRSDEISVISLPSVMFRPLFCCPFTTWNEHADMRPCYLEMSYLCELIRLIFNQVGVYRII